MVSLFGTTYSKADLEGVEFGNADQSRCFDRGGGLVRVDRVPENARTVRRNKLHVKHKRASSPESKLICVAIQTVPDKLVLTNPMNYITGDNTPFFIENVITECNISPIQNKKPADAVSAVIGPNKVTCVSIEGLVTVAASLGPPKTWPWGLPSWINI